VDCRVQFLKCVYPALYILNCTSSKPLTRRYDIAQAPPKALFCPPQSSPTSNPDTHPARSLAISIFACSFVFHSPLLRATQDPRPTHHHHVQTPLSHACHPHAIGSGGAPLFQNSSPRNNPVKPELKLPVVRWSACKCGQQQPLHCHCVPDQDRRAPAILLFPRIPHVSSFSQGAASRRALGGHNTAGSTLCPSGLTAPTSRSCDRGRPPCACTFRGPLSLLLRFLTPRH